MKKRIYCLPLNVLLVVLLLFTCLSVVGAQEPELDTGRPADAKPVPAPSPAEAPPATLMAGSDADEPGASMAGGVVIQDQVINDDLIVQSSLCVGFDCINGENFGFDTIRLKENNLQIHFDDTSISSGFPYNDWRIIINDSANGGQSYFSIQDSTASKTPFKIEAGARTDSIRVDNSGRVGLGTADPVLELHITDGDTPSVRLDQQGGGWTPQIWDVAGNEANFFIRDVTNGSRLPFRIQPNAPTNSIYIASDGSVGMGTSSPEGVFHVFGNGDPDAMILQANGNLTLGGLLTEMSDASHNENFAPVDGGEVLARLAAMPVQTWNFKHDDSRPRHIGPTAQDFHAAFGLGEDDRRIAPLDTNGIALAAIQELARRVEALERENASLRAELEMIHR